MFEGSPRNHGQTPRRDRAQRRRTRDALALVVRTQTALREVLKLSLETGFARARPSRRRDSGGEGTPFVVFFPSANSGRPITYRIRGGVSGCWFTNPRNGLDSKNVDYLPRIGLLDLRMLETDVGSSNAKAHVGIAT